MEANDADSGNRRWIQVQLPEPTPEQSEARKLGYPTLSSVARARLGLAGDRIQSRVTGGDVDCGFRAYRLTDTSFSKWQMSSEVEEGVLQQHLLSLRESASDEVSPDELLTEVLLKQGYSLTEGVTEELVAGLDTRIVRDSDGDIAVLAYLVEDTKPSLEQLRTLVDESPTRIIVLEDAFRGDDQLKTNLAQLCKSKGIELWTA
jgi:adenine-specific DNA-methyltransferase